MKKILLVLFLSVTCANISFADDWFSEDSTDIYYNKKENIANLYDNLVGVRYSNISGFGLSLSRRFANNYEILVCGLAHYRQNIQWEDTRKLVITKETKDVLLDFGIEFKRDFITTSTTCIYGLIGAYYSDDTNGDKQGENYDRENSVKTFSAGVGIGLRVFLEKRFSANFNFGYKYDNIDKLNDNVPDWTGGTYVGLGVGVDFGF
ncbi:MAG: hypothetical protein V1779_00355 [bacterium]